MGGFAFTNPDDEEEKARILREFLAQDSPPDPTLDATAKIVQEADPSPAPAPSPLPEAATRAPAEPDTRALAYLAAREKDLASTPTTPTPASSSSGGGGGFDWGTIGALLLDAAGNKGRGAGQIIGAYASNKEANAREKRQHDEHLAEIAARKANDPMTTYMQLMRLEQGDQRLHAGQTSAEQAQQRIDEQLRMHKALADINSPEMQAKIKLREEGAAGAARGRITTEADLSSLMAQTAAEKAAATSEASTNAATDALRANPRDLTEEQKIANARAADAEARAARAERTTNVDKFSKDVGNMIEVAKSSRELLKLFGDAEKAGGPRHSLGGGVDYPGIGVVDANKLAGARSPEDTAANTELNILRSFVQGPITGAAVGGKEESTRIGELAGKATGWSATEQDARAAIAALKDLAESRIKQYGVGREDIAREALKSHKLDDLFAAVPAAAAAVDTPEPGDTPDITPPPAAEIFVPKPAGSYGKSKAAPVTEGELGNLPATPEDWKKRFERWKRGGASAQP